MSAHAASGPVLVLDASGPIGSIALVRGGEVVSEARLEHRAEHAARLVPSIAEVLDAGAARRSELAAVAVGCGPGSFTGVRVAAATAKGLVHALGVPLFAVSSLAGAALSIPGTGVRYALFDARSDRIYGACYRIGATSTEELRAPHGGVLAEVLTGADPGAGFVGDGAERHRSALEAAGLEVLIPSDHDTIARGIARYLTLTPDIRPVRDPHGWEPTYIRGSGAMPMGSGDK